MNRKNLTEKQSQRQRRTDGERSRQRQKEERQSLSRRDKNQGKSQRSRAVKLSDRDIKKERRQITLFLAIFSPFGFHETTSPSDKSLRIGVYYMLPTLEHRLRFGT